MLYDASGNPIGEVKREHECNLTFGNFFYSVLPKAEEAGSPYAVFNPRYKHAPFEAIWIGEDLPEKIRPLAAVYKKILKLGLPPNIAFHYELKAARELGIEKEYLEFMSTDEAFRAVKKTRNCGSELLDLRCKPRTSQKEMENFLREKADADRFFFEGKLTEGEYELVQEQISERYAGKIFPEDRLVFADEKRFKEFLHSVKRWNPHLRDWADDVYKHEREHYESIKDDPGLKSISYDIWLLTEGKITALFPEVNATGKTNTDQARIRKKAIEAVTEKSPIDQYCLSGRVIQ